MADVVHKDRLRYTTALVAASISYGTNVILQAHCRKTPTTRLFSFAKRTQKQEDFRILDVVLYRTRMILT